MHGGFDLNFLTDYFSTIKYTLKLKTSLLIDIFLEYINRWPFNYMTELVYALVLVLMWKCYFFIYFVQATMNLNDFII